MMQQYHYITQTDKQTGCTQGTTEGGHWTMECIPAGNIWNHKGKNHPNILKWKAGLK